MKKMRWNRFPDRDDQPRLYTHDITYLLSVLRISPSGLVRHPVGPHLKTVMDWSRHHGYNPNSMPRTYVDAIYEAAFSGRGVVEWIAKTFQLPC
jgi:hypothetical protein